MIYSIIINIIVYIFIIICLHSLWNYLLNMYTTRKTKDLVNTQIHKYKKIIEEIENQRDFIKEKNTEKEISSQELNDYISEQMAHLQER